MIARASLLLAFALAAGGCTGPATSSSEQPGSPSPTTSAPVTMSAAPSPDEAAPGRPYDAESILELMRESRRPGGVPDELMTLEIGGAVSVQLWTWSGRPWTRVSISGACTPDACTLEIAGTPADADESDVYTLTIDPGPGSASVITADLHGLPRDMWTDLDRIARDGVGVADLDGLELGSVRWFPPPDHHQFALAYRSGGEEGARALDVLVDLSSGEVLETKEPAG